MIEDNAFVLPPRTKLNSCIYLESQDGIKGNTILNTTKLAERKICNDIRIPSYKGFSIVNDNSNFRQIGKPNKSIDLHNENHRKVRKIVNFENEAETKVIAKKKKKEIPKQKDIEKCVEDKSLKQRTESFWMEKDSNLHLKKKKYQPVDLSPKISQRKFKKSDKYYDSNQIQKSIELSRNNRRIDKKLKEEQIKEKNDKIQANLLSLMESQKSQGKMRPQESRKKKIIADEEKENEPELGEMGDVESCRDSSSSMLSKYNWKPLSPDKLDFMKTFNNYSSPTKVSDKSLVSLRERITEGIQNLMENVEKTSNCFYEEIQKMEARKKCSLDTKTSRQICSSTRSSCSSKTSNSTNSSIKQSVMPKITANRARRQLEIEKNYTKRHPYVFDDTSDSSTDSVEYAERLARLNAENYDRQREHRGNRQLFGVHQMDRGDHKITKSKSHKSQEKLDRWATLTNDSLAFHKVHSLHKQIRFSETIKVSEIQDEGGSVGHKVTSTYSNTFSSTSSKKSVGRTSVSEDKRVVSESKQLIMSEFENKEEKAYDTEDDSSSLYEKEEMEIENEFKSIISSSTTKSSPRLSRSHDNRRDFSAHKQRRLSPKSLEAQFLASLHHNDAMETGYNYALETERLQGISLAQQETVSLAQLLKSQQQLNEANSNGKMIQFDVIREVLKELLNEKLVDMGQRPKPGDDDDGSSRSTRSSSDTSERNPLPKRQQTKIINRKPSSSSSSISNTTSSENNEIQEEIVVDNTEIPEEIITIKSTSDRNSIEEVDDISIAKNSESQSTIQTDRSIKESIKTVSDSVSSASSVQSEIKSDKSISASVKSTKDISTEPNSNLPGSKSTSSVKSVATDLSQKSISEEAVTVTSDNKKSTTDRNQSYSTNTFEEVVEVSMKEKEEFNTSISDFINDVQLRINSLEDQKKKKIDTFKKLKKKLKYTKYLREEKNLKQQIEMLDNHIKSIEKEEEDLVNMSMSCSLSDISVLTEPKESKPKTNNLIKSSNSTKIPTAKINDNILPNHHSKSKSSDATTTSSSSTTHKSSSTSSVSSSSHATLSKNDDIKTEMSMTYKDNTFEVSTRSKNDDKDASTTSTITDSRHDELDVNGATSTSKLVSEKKVEEIDTPRSVKQLKFGEINEEYSASDRDSSEIVVGVVSDDKMMDQPTESFGSKSDKYHVLKLTDETNLNNNNELKELEKKDEKEDEEEFDDNILYSARTIHSEISEIPEEVDDDDDDDKIDLNDVSEVKPDSVYNDLYSNDFSEVNSVASISKHSPNEKKPQDIDTINSIHDDNLSYEPSEDISSTEVSVQPDIPPRVKKDKPDEASSEKDNVNGVLDNITNHLLTTVLSDVTNNIITVPPIASVDEVDDEEEEEEEEEEYILQDKSVETRDEKIDSTLKEVDMSQVQYLVLLEYDDLLPIIHESVEYLFHAIHNKSPEMKTMDVLENCSSLDQFPEIVSKPNSNEVCQKIMAHISLMSRHPSRLPVTTGKCISKLVIYHAILDIVKDVYELDDKQPEGVWMKKHFNAEKSRKFKLWGDVKKPATAKRLIEIVTEKFYEQRILYKDSIGPFKRSRKQQWFYDRQEDYVDRILVDELFREDWEWQTYFAAENIIINQMSNNITENVLTEICQSLLANINRDVQN